MCSLTTIHCGATYAYNPIGKRLISGELRWQLEEDTPE